MIYFLCFFFFSSRRRHTRCLSDWSSDVCSSDLNCLVADRSGLAHQRQESRLKRVFCGDVAKHAPADAKDHRSEERRVGKECRSRWSQEHYKERKSIRIMSRRLTTTRRTRLRSSN